MSAPSPVPDPRARLTYAALALFTLALGAAIVHYPGGSWADARADGFVMLRNYWCDLMRAEAVDGSPNATSAGLSKLAFGLLAAALLSFWPLATAWLPARRSRVATIALGTTSALGVVLLALIPYDTEPTLHAIAALLAGAGGTAAAAIVVVGTWHRGPWLTARRVTGVVLALAAITNIAVYVPLVIERGDSAVLPVVQKFATPLLLLWMVVTTAAAARAERR